MSDEYPQEYTISRAKETQPYAPLAGGEGDLFYPATTTQPSTPHRERHTRDSSQAAPVVITTSAQLSPDQIELVDAQHKAIAQWSLRVKVCFGIHLVGAACLLHSFYWFTTVIGVVCLIAIGLYAYSIKQHQKNTVLMCVAIVLANLAKNSIILYFYFIKRRDGHILDPYEVFLVILLLTDCVIFTPISLYSCFFLHRSISLTHLTF